MAFYLFIRELQPPFDTGVLDSIGRTVWTFNVMATKHPSDRFQEEILAILVDAGIGTLNVDLFVGSKANIPKDAGPYTSIVASGGAAGIRTHTRFGPTHERPAAQITVRAMNGLLAEAKARAAYAALTAVNNQVVTPA